MRLLHPDLSAALGDEAITQANALAALLNEIYDVRMWGIWWQACMQVVVVRGGIKHVLTVST
jgi:hypothetical protein